MRGLFGFFVVFALGLIPLIGCGEEEQGRAVCNDGNACTLDYREWEWGPCEFEPWPDGWPCVSGGVTGVCVAGECGKNRCEDVVCDDGDICTDDSCIHANGTCEYAPCCDFWNWTEYVDIRVCDFGGVDGICMDGACEENLCKDVVCDEGDPCSVWECNYLDGDCYLVGYIDPCIYWNTVRP